MLHMRRFRAFLLITVILFVAIYELYTWNGTQIEGLSDLPGFRHGDRHTNQPPDLIRPPAMTEPPPPSYLKPERPPAPPSVALDQNPGGSRPQEAIQKPDRAGTRTGPSRSARTITGEKILADQPAEHKQPQHEEDRPDAPPRPSETPKTRWREQDEHFPVQKMMTLPVGEPEPLPAIQAKFEQESLSEKNDRKIKQNHVRRAFQHSWEGYMKYAAGDDELKPLTNSSGNSFNGWGATLVDSLDTMWIMGLKDEFEHAVGDVSKIDFRTSSDKKIPMFETTIRYLGGLLGAYDISGNQYTVLLDKAVELGDIMLGAFDTPNRMPIPYYQWAPSYTSQRHRSDTNVVMAELGSMAIEFTRLAQLTKEEKYYDAIARCTNALEEMQMKTTFPGVWPLRIDSTGCKKRKSNSDHSKKSDESTILRKRQADDAPEDETVISPADVAGEEPADFVAPVDENEDDFDDDCETQGLAHEPDAKKHTYGIAAMSDSTYEYFPKMHGLLGGLNSQYRSMYLKSADVIRKDFIYRPMLKDEKRDVRFLKKHVLRSDTTSLLEPEKRTETIYEGTHLGCYVGGMFALGSKIFDLPNDMALAAKLTDACVWAYESMPVGIMPDEFALTPCLDETNCPYDESRWHDFLDPDLQERLDAAAIYNAQHKAPAKPSRESDSNTRTETENEHLGPSDKRKRQQIDDYQPSKSPGVPAWQAPERPLSIQNDKPSKDSDYFVPQVPISHTKFVAAKISEERLPSPYTSIDDSAYKMRPEAIESVFIMYRLTGDKVWREKGWKMFQAVESATWTASGHAVVKDVASELHGLEDKMETFWLAETLKYFYLLFADEDVVSLDEWVFNTEAHPMRLPKRKGMVAVT